MKPVGHSRWQSNKDLDTWPITAIQSCSNTYKRVDACMQTTSTIRQFEVFCTRSHNDWLLATTTGHAEVFYNRVDGGDEIQRREQTRNPSVSNTQDSSPDWVCDCCELQSRLFGKHSKALEQNKHKTRHLAGLSRRRAEAVKNKKKKKEKRRRQQYYKEMIDFLQHHETCYSLESALNDKNSNQQY
ncbi:unnamed protein product [Protopolystoma xenopodis]|uniref:Uncharacterized protein n=1 Tax=Protopolystoma xenopodis TaxID=117903 RepID=A0A448X269_9PLAT|nr:unnamed protein product [Protopolystoma xenopodis]